MYGVVQDEGLDMVAVLFWPRGSVREVCNVHVSIELRHLGRVMGAAYLSKRRHAPLVRYGLRRVHSSGRVRTAVTTSSVELSSLAAMVSVVYVLRFS